MPHGAVLCEQRKPSGVINVLALLVALPAGGGCSLHPLPMVPRSSYRIPPQGHHGLGSSPRPPTSTLLWLLPRLQAPSCPHQPVGHGDALTRQEGGGCWHQQIKLGKHIQPSRRPARRSSLGAVRHRFCAPQLRLSACLMPPVTLPAAARAPSEAGDEGADALPLCGDYISSRLLSSERCSQSRHVTQSRAIASDSFVLKNNGHDGAVKPDF